MKRVYIAHPLVGDGSPEWGDMEANVERYIRFVASALNDGHVVLSWIHHYMTHVRGLTSGDADFYLSRDREILRDADELWVAGPASVSNGMRFEIEVAEEFGIPIRHEPEWDDPSYLPDAPEGWEESRHMKILEVRKDGTLRAVHMVRPCPNPGCCEPWLVKLSPPGTFDYVFCGSCGMRGPTFDGHMEDAVAGWNALPWSSGQEELRGAMCRACLLSPDNLAELAGLDLHPVPLNPDRDQSIDGTRRRSAEDEASFREALERPSDDS